MIKQKVIEDTDDEEGHAAKSDEDAVKLDYSPPSKATPKATVPSTGSTG